MLRLTDNQMDQELFDIIHVVAKERYGAALQQIEVEVCHMGTHQITIFFGYDKHVRYVQGDLDHAYLARYRREELPGIIEEWARRLVNV